jgi:hypothetical protein
MKKISVVFLMVFVTFISCNNDDDNNGNNSNTPEIVGIWSMEKYIDQEGESMLSDCDKQTVFEFLESGLFNFTVYVDNFDETGCEIINQTSGNWEIISDNEIKFSNNLNQVNMVEYEIFQENGNTFLEIFDFVSDNNFTEITYIKN